MIWANPRADVTLSLVHTMSTQVLQVRYVHRDNDEQYKHDFSDGVSMVAVKDAEGNQAIMLYRRDGKPIWKDFK